MRRILPLLLCVVSTAALAQAAEKGTEKKAAKEADLGKKESSIAPDKSLAGDVTRKKKKEEIAPSLNYDEFRLGVESQVNTKRKEQIEDLKKIIELSTDKAERPKLLFRLGESKRCWFDITLIFLTHLLSLLSKHEVYLRCIVNLLAHDIQRTFLP